MGGRGIDPRNVLQMSGATGANLAVLYTLVNPGDHVVAEYPTYQPLYEIPRASWVPPRGVSTSFIRLDLPMDDEAFCRKLLATRGVLLVPGSRFELPCGARLGYCAQGETLRRGLDELSCALRELD